MKQPKYLAPIVLMSILLITGGVIWGSALATPPQHVRNWEWNANTSLGAVSLTTSNIILYQTVTSQPGNLPTQSIQITDDATSGEPDLYFNATIDAAVNANRNNNGNASSTKRLKFGDPPLSMDGRFNYLSITRGTNGTNTNVKCRVTAVY